MSQRRFYTASWNTLIATHRLAPLPVLPVRISRGAPKYWSLGDRWPAAPELFVPGWMLRSDVDRASKERAYRKGLNLDRITARLYTIAQEWGADGLALACFEKDPADCHRSWAARWLGEHGVDVRELALLTGADGGWVLASACSTGETGNRRETP